MKTTILILIIILFSVNANSQVEINSKELGEFKNGVGYYVYNNECLLLNKDLEKIDIKNIQFSRGTPFFISSENFISVWNNDLSNVKHYNHKGDLIHEINSPFGSTEYSENIAIIVTSKEKISENEQNRYHFKYLYNLDFIDTLGNTIFSKKVTDITNLPKFQNGLCIIPFSNGKTQIINKKGEVQFELNAQRPTVKQFSEGRAFLRVYIDNESKWVYLDTIGDIYQDILFTYEPSDFSDNLALIQNKDGKYGYMNKNGEIVITPQYANAFSFNSGLAVVQEYRLDSSFKIINTNNEVINVITGAFPVSGIKDGIIKVRDIHNNHGFMNLKGEIIVPLEYSTLSDFDSGISYFEIRLGNSQKGYLNMQGEKILVLKSSEY